MRRLLEFLGSATVLASSNLCLGHEAQAFVPSAPKEPSPMTVLDQMRGEMRKHEMPQPEINCENLLNARRQVYEQGPEIVAAFKDTANNKEITGYIAYEMARSINTIEGLLEGKQPSDTVSARLEEINDHTRLAREIEPKIVEEFNRAARILRSGPQMMDVAVFRVLESYIGGCPGDAQYQGSVPLDKGQENVALAKVAPVPRKP